MKRQSLDAAKKCILLKTKMKSVVFCKNNCELEDKKTHWSCRLLTAHYALHFKEKTGSRKILLTFSFLFYEQFVGHPCRKERPCEAAAAQGDGESHSFRDGGAAGSPSQITRCDSTHGAGHDTHLFL